MSRTLIFLGIAAAAAAAALVILAGGPSGPTSTDESTQAGRTLRAAQPQGNVVYWVTPGPRRIDPAVFGTPSNPKLTGQQAMSQAKGPIKQLLKDLPILVGLPPQARGTTDDGRQYAKTNMPTPFGDSGKVTSGQLDIRYIDRESGDNPGPPGKTEDTVDADISFTDPAGNSYRVEIDHVVQPPIPGYETDGGVLVDGYHHGTTRTGSPLMPKVYTYGAFWSLANVYINGELADERKMTHCMTTQTVRDSQYRLAFGERLPLPLDETIAGQRHHTHCIVLPVTGTPDGPVYQPVKTAFQLPNGQTQPFIHIMYEQDEIRETPAGFSEPSSLKQQASTTPQTTNDQATGSSESVDRTIEVTASEYEFAPSTLNVAPGETVQVKLENDGQIAHNFTVKTLGKSTATIQPGKTSTLTFTAPEKSGTYPIRFVCSVPGHKDAGMIGEIVVSE
ncbi:MAG: cupredoxin domain-containing protein [Candidatus Bipolaricaulia bacterium]